MVDDVPAVAPKVGDRIPVIFRHPDNDDIYDFREVVVTEIDDDGTIHLETV